MKQSYLAFLIGSVIILSCNQKTDETFAIKAVIEKETATWRIADIKGHADCWHIQPYTRILVSTADAKHNNKSNPRYNGRQKCISKHKL
jgi:hypothetical protein